jgi:hypothetical protein
MYSIHSGDDRKGVKIKVGAQDYYFSRDFVLKELRALAESKKEVQSLPVSEAPVPLRSIVAFWHASQSIMGKHIAGDDHIWHFLISDRVITCPHDKKCYMDDKALRDQYKTIFAKPAISYLAMATCLATVNLSDPAVARVMLNCLMGDVYDTDPCPVLPVILAALLIAEPNRHPSVFLPTLMCLDLIRQNYSSGGITYSFDNSLQSPILVRQAQGQELDSFADFILPKLLGMPTRSDLDGNCHIRVQNETLEADFFNTRKRTNGYRDVNKLWTSAALMQAGGFFPMTHRFSYTELSAEGHRPDGTGSDQKCFYLFVDWLAMKGAAEPIHKATMQTLKNCVPIDKGLGILRKILQHLWDNIGSYLNGSDAPVQLNFGAPTYEDMAASVPAQSLEQTLQDIALNPSVFHENEHENTGELCAP